LQGLARRFDVTLFSFYTEQSQLQFRSEAEKLCSDVHLHYREKKYAKLDLLKGLISPRPFSVLNYWSPEVFGLLQQLNREQHFDVIQAEHTVLAEYVGKLDCQIKVLDFHNLKYEKMQRFADCTDNTIQKIYARHTSGKLKKYELNLTKSMDLCLTCSEREKQLLQRARPDAKLLCIPNGTDIDSSAVDEQADASRKPHPVNSDTPAILFIGAFDAEKNVDAVLYFTEQIFPYILAARPDITVKIVGSPVPQVIAELDKDSRIEILGYVEDLTPLFNSKAIAIVPLRYGGGTRLKIPEAMAHGVPVITTSIGCEGLDVTHDENILIADEPEAFAAHCIRLLESDNLRQRIVSDGLRLVKEKYDWQIISQNLADNISAMLPAAD
jgi:glycosyltransferase involved in cell wall biosynthesis